MRFTHISELPKIGYHIQDDKSGFETDGDNNAIPFFNVFEVLY